MKTIKKLFNTRFGNLFAPVLALSVGIVVLPGCQEPGEKIETAQEKVTDATQDLKEARRDARAVWYENWLAFKRDNDEEVAANERRIIELRKEVADIDVRYRSSYDTSIDEFERINNALEYRVNNYKDEGDEKWEVFKRDVVREMSELKASLSKFDVKDA